MHVDDNYYMHYINLLQVGMIVVSMRYLEKDLEHGHLYIMDNKTCQRHCISIYSELAVFLVDGGVHVDDTFVCKQQQ